MEGLKKLEEEQRSFFEAGAKISLIEEKERTVNARIQDLINEEKKNLGNLDDLSNELGTSKNKIDQLDAKIIEQIKSDTKKALAKVESSLTKNDEGNLTESFRSFWQKGYDFGQGQSGDASEKIEALKKQFLERNNQIIKDIESLKKDLNKEKSELTSFIELRKNQELKVMELKANQDRSNEELRKYETEITKLETEKDRIVHQRNEKELNKRSIEIEVKEKQEKLNSFDEIKDIEGERGDIIVELEKLQKRIMNLGPINFAAPETLEAEVQRKEVLSGQIEELEVSLNKLDEAIKKIDRESNKSFHDCLNSVNKHLEEMFPKLFGGGFCKLDLLDKTEDSGLLLMARLPGKKNTKLSQLSGGEKALTALALVFSLFSINPAPFCLLDEVDAPLDDENTSRFINLVNEMSTKVQFIFVTHNKISMEKSTHLLGVTMRDLGVSKVVSVDVEQAMELAQS
jgi:chromosome segregation protein